MTQQKLYGKITTTVGAEYYVVGFFSDDFSFYAHAYLWIDPNGVAEIEMKDKRQWMTGGIFLDKDDPKGKIIFFLFGLAPIIEHAELTSFNQDFPEFVEEFEYDFDF